MVEKIDKVAFVYIKDGRLLCARSKGKELYYMPGGKREAGETDQQALVRELKEELSIDVIPSSLKWMGIFEAQAHGKPEGTVVKLLCYTGEFKGDIRPAAEVEEVGWLTYADKDKMTVAGQELLDWLRHWKLMK